MKIAKTIYPDDYQNRPLPQARTRIVANRKYSPDEIARIKRGFTPTGSDDRWLIYFSHNRLYIHRSWTGFCIYVAHFKQKNNNYILHLIEANRDPKQYAGIDDAWPTKTARRTIRHSCATFYKNLPHLTFAKIPLSRGPVTPVKAPTSAPPPRPLAKDGTRRDKKLRKRAFLSCLAKGRQTNSSMFTHLLAKTRNHDYLQLPPPPPVFGGFDVITVSQRFLRSLTSVAH